jgi:poly(3-hydroxybutyrate) depolymerase
MMRFSNVDGTELMNVLLLSHQPDGPVAFVFSSFETKKYIWLAVSINLCQLKRLQTQCIITQRNYLSKAYYWKNTADNQVIEVFYPPENPMKNLPLLVLIHGGECSSPNELQATGTTSYIAATAWLVLEPNHEDRQDVNFSANFAALTTR